jgi:hypothetical protein
MPADLTTVLGRLLADPALRAELRRDPGAVARLLDADAAALRELYLEDLERQAETLLDKRFHEVEKLLPQTVAQLGARAAEAFREHALGYWPEGCWRHAEDAAAFGRFLEERKLPRSESELNRLHFAMGTGRLSLRFAADARVGGRPRRALQLLYRRRGAVRSLAFYAEF